jgi:hypothetical protein
MRLPDLSILVALAFLVGVCPQNAPGSGKATGSSSKSGSSSRPSGSAPGNPGIFFPASNYRPYVPNGYTGNRGSIRLKNGARVVPVQIDFTVTFNTDVGKVRSIDPPEEYDDKGNLKKHTAAELKKLKGDDPAEKKMVGYKSDFSDLQAGDIVQVALSVHRNEPPKNGKDGKADDKAAAADTKDETKPGNWVVAGLLLGKVTKIDNANTDSAPKVTIQVTTAQIVQQGQRAAGNRKQMISHEQAQATIIVIGHRPVGPPRS